MISAVANGTVDQVLVLCIRGSELFVGGLGPAFHFGRINITTNSWLSFPTTGAPDGISY